jgi:threonine/homoserine/homoserine lactone efflux protein
MAEAFWLGLLLGIGAAVAVGPIFVTIVQEAAARGFGSSLRVILGSATADLVLLIPALAFSWLIARVAQAAFWVGLAGTVVFLYLSWEAARDAWRLWTGKKALVAPSGWSFWKGMLGNLANPLTWTFWLATGTPTMLRAYYLGGGWGLALFTATWFVVAMAIESIVALVVVRSGQLLGRRAQSAFNSLASAMFLALAVTMVSQVLLGK